MALGEEHGPSASDEFDVFLCHNSADKAAVQRVAEQLRELGLKPWLDHERLRPGFPAMRGLQEQVGVVKSVAVFVGASGIGPWQKVEICAFLGELVERGCPVIPVLLPDCPAKPPLPPFVKMNTWVDMRETEADAIGRLYWGITGTRLLISAATDPGTATPRDYRTVDMGRAVPLVLLILGVAVVVLGVFLKGGPQSQNGIDIPVVPRRVAASQAPLEADPALASRLTLATDVAEFPQLPFAGSLSDSSPSLRARVVSEPNFVSAGPRMLRFSVQSLIRAFLRAIGTDSSESSVALDCKEKDAVSEMCNYRGNLRGVNGAPLGNIKVELMGTNCHTTTNQFGFFDFRGCDRNETLRLLRPRIYLHLHTSDPCPSIPLLFPPLVTEVHIDLKNCRESTTATQPSSNLRIHAESREGTRKVKRPSEPTSKRAQRSQPESRER